MKAKKATSKKTPAKAKKKAPASGLTMYGHKLDSIVDLVTAHLRKVGKASRPAIGFAISEHDKAPKWTAELTGNERFRVVRKVLGHLERAGKVTQRMGKSKRGNEAHLYQLAK